MEKVTVYNVDVKCILGDPGLHSDLVEDVDCEFGRVVDLVKRGYRLKRQDWLNRSVDIAVAEAEVDENNSVPGIDATDQEKIEFLNNKVVSLEERVKYLEGLLNIRGETVKVNYFLYLFRVVNDKKIHMLLTCNRKLRSQKKLKPPQKPRNNHKKKRNNNKKMIQKTMWTMVIKRVKTETNEEQKQEEEEQQQEDDTEVNTDVDVGAKENGSENPVKGSKKRGRKDGEENEDAYEKPVKVTRKSERVTKVNISLCIMLYKMLFSIINVTFFYCVIKKLKGGEVNEDASEKSP
ncbi:unnamed protein product [Brassica napus]|uniref:(rape) hypothetical protein n=1 Tax=Brassica napus TaxID=3708 RepID=A0A816PNW0_BRANA|nr:unnamed protein product [Brassica napus]